MMLTSDTKYAVKLFLSKNRISKVVFGGLLLLIAFLFYHLKSYWSFVRILGKYEKLFESTILEGNQGPLLSRLCDYRTALLSEHDHHQIYASFLKSAKAQAIINRYLAYQTKDRVRIRYQNEDNPDREGNLLILEPYKPHTNTKGIAYLQYNQSLLEFAALFDLAKFYDHYLLVVEPSSWGYCDIGLELLLQGQHPIYVMAQDQIDFELCKRLDSRIVPIRAGAGDWIDPQKTQISVDDKKLFDVCMVASWRKLKNHKVLFKELASLGAGLRIALVGYPWENRTAASIRQEQNRYYPDSLVSIFESVPHEYVFRVLSHSRVALMLSEREGANRGIYEALASNVPVVMLDSNRGVNKNLVNEDCIVTSSPSALATSVKRLLASTEPTTARQKLLGISGADNTWNKIKQAIAERSGDLLSDTRIIQSTPNLKYIDAETKLTMDKEFEFIEQFLRPQKNGN